MSRDLTMSRIVLSFLTIGAAICCGAALQSPDASASAGTQDSGWPRVFQKGDDQVLLHQPQVESWDNYSKISFRAALEVKVDDQPPAYGVITAKANTFVDHDNRTVFMTDLDSDVQFAKLPADEAKKLEKVVHDVLPHKDYLAVSLDRVLACIKPDQAKLPVVNVNLAPPPIFVSQSPAILVIFMGPPRFKPIEGTRLMFAVNTNWDVLLDQNSGQYYLLDKDSWLTAPDPIKGPWTAAQTLPPAFSQLPAGQQWADIRQHIPGQVATSPPHVFTSTEPAELIVTQGAPEYSPVSGTSLLYVSNPVMPLFLDATNNTYYFLAAGRWFSAPSLSGPWAAASHDLPADFARIPSDSPAGFVLASVPNTPEAREAILLASVPHTATIQRSAAKVDVEYQGAPKFGEIQGTTLQYAVNSNYPVIAADGQYYCCANGVWFVGPVASGPWEVCASVPPDIYTIPPTSPLYNVTYVKVYSETPDTVVFGYTGGYSGDYLADTGTLVFGAGMLAGAALAGDYWYPYCNPAYFSYGCAATYHYGYGTFARGAAYYGPYGGAGHYAAYNPATGTFSHGSYHYGPRGASEVHQAYNPFTDTYRGHVAGTNGYQSWGHSVATRGDDWASAGHVSGAAGQVGHIETSGGRSVVGVQGAGGGRAVKTGSGDLYAGKDGNVYRRTGAGDWQHWGGTGSSWQPAHLNSSWANRGFQDRLNDDWASRLRGNDLASRFGGLRGGGFGGFRGGGFGGFRGGFRR
jgi:hypothetical protein